jgi:cytochrome P450
MLYCVLRRRQIRSSALQQIHKIRSSGAEGDSMMHFLVHHATGLGDDEVVDELMCLVMAGHESE